MEKRRGLPPTRWRLRAGASLGMVRPSRYPANGRPMDTYPRAVHASPPGLARTWHGALAQLFGPRPGLRPGPLGAAAAPVRVTRAVRQGRVPASSTASGAVGATPTCGPRHAAAPAPEANPCGGPYCCQARVCGGAARTACRGGRAT